MIGVGIVLYETDNTTVLTAINWGSLYAGESSSYLGYIENIENYEVGISATTNNTVIDLSPTTFPWWLTFSCNMTGQTIQEYSRVPVLYQLDTDAGSPDGAEFTFDIIVNATTTK